MTIDERDADEQRARGCSDAPHSCGGEVIGAVRKARQYEARTISDATQSTAASAQPRSGQPAIAKTGSASAMTVAPAIVGASRLGIGRGVEKIPALTSGQRAPAE